MREKRHHEFREYKRVPFREKKGISKEDDGNPVLRSDYDEEQEYEKNSSKKRRGREVPESEDYESGELTGTEASIERVTSSEKRNVHAKKINRFDRNSKGVIEKVKHSISSRTNMESADYIGNNKEDNITTPAVNTMKRTAGVVGVVVMAAVKAVISFFSTAVGILVLISAVVITTVVVTLQTMTYEVIVDDETHVRELVSNITYELSNEIEYVKTENDCDTIISTGELAEWKEIIALWWTLKMHLSESEEWENYFTSDQEDLEYIFYQFNHIEYTVSEEQAENGMGRRILHVSITNTSLDELREHWGLTTEQNRYLDEMLADEELWKELLGVTELSRIATNELGNAVTKYSDWYGQEGDTAIFVTWCMSQAGLINPAYIQGAATAEELKKELYKKGLIQFFNEPEEGDIAFVKSGDNLDAGIVTRIEDDTVYIAFGGINGKSYVEESVYNKSSYAIDCYAHVGIFFVESLSVTSNMFSWPVDGYYYVTSAYGARDLEGTTFHHGLDIGCPEGTGILAGGSGEVIIARYNSSLGNYIVIDHGNGITTTYGHNSELLVEVGDKVNKGQRIAKAGNTGFSFGSHCHFAVQLNGVYVNPASYLGLPEDFTGNATSYVR